MDVIKFLKKNGKLFQRGELEKYSGIRRGMISQMIRGEGRYLTDEQSEKARKHLEKLHGALTEFLKQ